MRLLILGGPSAGFLAAQTPGANSLMAQAGIDQVNVQEQRAPWTYRRRQPLRMTRRSALTAPEEYRNCVVLQDFRQIKKQFIFFDGRRFKNVAYLNNDCMGRRYHRLDLGGALFGWTPASSMDRKKPINGIEAYVFSLVCHEQLKYAFRLEGGLKDCRENETRRIPLKPKGRARRLDTDEGGGAIRKGEAPANAAGFQPAGVTNSFGREGGSRDPHPAGRRQERAGVQSEPPQSCRWRLVPSRLRGKLEVTGWLFHRRTVGISLVDISSRHAAVSSRTACAKDGH